MQQANVKQFYSSQNYQLNDWQNGSQFDLTKDYFPLQNYGYYEPDQSVMDPSPSDASTFNPTAAIT